MKKTLLLLFALSLGFTPVFSQSHNSTPNHSDINFSYGLMLNGNFGGQNYGDFDFNPDFAVGQDFLGGNEYGFESGVDALFILPSGLFVKGSAYWARGFNYSTRGESLDINGRWSGKGQSLGIGYGLIDNKGFNVFPSISFGRHKSNWTFINEHTAAHIPFGDAFMLPSTSNDFYSKNYFLDFNVLIGRVIFLNKGQSNAGINAQVTLGYRQGLHKARWYQSGSNEQVGELNETVFMGWYVKLSTGLSFFSKQ